MKDIFDFYTFLDRHPWIESIVMVTILLFIVIALALYWYLIRYVYYNISEYVAIIMVVFPILVIMFRIKIDK